MIRKNNESLSAVLQEVKSYQHTGLISIIEDFVASCVEIDSLLQLNDSASTTKEEMKNSSGDYQTAIDVKSNDILSKRLSQNPHVNLIASEEIDKPIIFERANKDLFNVFFDPIDGSGNLISQQIVGSIFSIYENKNLELQPGSMQVAAGYVIYSKPMMLVIAIKNNVFSFTYLQRDRRFSLTHKKIKLPKKSNYLYVNLSNQHKWNALLRNFIKQFFELGNGNMRWSGCMVADIHRLLITGGIFMYPTSYKKNENLDKLRLMYEANPMAMIIKNAGGYSSCGSEDILDINPLSLHQKIAFFTGDSEKIKGIEMGGYNFSET